MTVRRPTSSTTARPLAGMETGAPASSSIKAGAPIIFLTLPVPPSLNRAFANSRGKGKRGRTKTREAIDWKLYAGHVLRAQTSVRLTGEVLVVMNVERKSATADVDNRVKLLFDLLVTEGVITDDRFITGFATAWSPKHSDKVHLAIMPVGPVAISFQPSEKTGAVGGWIINAPNSEEEEAA